MKKITSNCDYPNLILSVLCIVFDIVVLAVYFATTEKVNWCGVLTSTFWMLLPVAFVIGLYKEGTKSE